VTCDLTVGRALATTAVPAPTAPTLEDCVVDKVRRACLPIAIELSVAALAFVLLVAADRHAERRLEATFRSRLQELQSRILQETAPSELPVPRAPEEEEATARYQQGRRAIYREFGRAYPPEWDAEVEHYERWLRWQERAGRP
jgi:hypothetical protein